MGLFLRQARGWESESQRIGIPSGLLGTEKSERCQIGWWPGGRLTLGTLGRLRGEEAESNLAFSLLVANAYTLT